MTAHTPTRNLGRAALSALLLVALFAASAAAAQSGRRKPTQGVSKVPPAEGTAAPKAEAGPAAAPEKKAAVTFVVMEFDNPLTGIDFRARAGVRDQFVRRLELSAGVAVKTGQRGNRKDARDRAKAEQEAYVVLFELEEAGYGSGGVGEADARTLYLRTYTYAPKTGDLKYSDSVFQRPYRTSARVGGIGIPIPTVNRYPSQHELEQAARDAADRLLSRFQLRPPNN
ncbi:MAG TPA: hypothetical protein VGX48_06945 [Pyrinomonadaceae bacterium]|jgi:hypothetical protein|nr:hypothetical protein [Pyrinomonadaceae bacterium]